MNVATRARRTVKVGWTAAAVWALYRIPAWGRRLRGVTFTAEQLSPTHERAARRILSLALDLRGVMIKMWQAVATRSDIFPKEFIEHLKQCHDAVPPKPFEVVREVARVGRHIKEDSVAIQIHPAVADYLCTEGRALLDEAEQSVGKHTVLLPTPACHIEDFDVIGVDTGFRPESSLRLLPDMVEEDEGTA